MPSWVPPWAVCVPPWVPLERVGVRPLPNYMTSRTVYALVRLAPDAVRITLHGADVLSSCPQTFSYLVLTRCETQDGNAAVRRDLKALPHNSF